MLPVQYVQSQSFHDMRKFFEKVLLQEYVNAELKEQCEYKREESDIIAKKINQEIRMILEDVLELRE